MVDVRVLIGAAGTQLARLELAARHTAMHQGYSIERPQRAVNLPFNTGGGPQSPREGRVRGRLMTLVKRTKSAEQPGNGRTGDGGGSMKMGTAVPSANLSRAFTEIRSIPHDHTAPDIPYYTAPYVDRDIAVRWPYRCC